QVIQESEWSRRGWTFQERLLSRRCVIFAEGRVYFQCRQWVASQDIFPVPEGNGWSLEWAEPPLRTLAELDKKAFWFYMKCVRLYTDRKLTRTGDILAAFEGVTWLLQQHFNAPLIFGLPTSHFDLALLWVPVKDVERRKANIRGKGQSDEEIPSYDNDQEH